jgi:hypothetical protein
MNSIGNSPQNLLFFKTSYLSYLVHDSFFGKKPKLKGPDGYSVNRKLLVDGIAIDL